MSNIISVPWANGQTYQLVEQLQTHITPPEGYALHVCEWYSPHVMQKDHLQNSEQDLLLSVKIQGSQTSRTYNMRPLCNTVTFEVSVWMHDSPDYDEHTKSPVRDELVRRVQHFFRVYPQMGTEKTTRNLDHAKGQVWILCTTITITQIIEK